MDPEDTRRAQERSRSETTPQEWPSPATTCGSPRSSTTGGSAHQPPGRPASWPRSRWAAGPPPCPPAPRGCGSRTAVTSTIQRLDHVRPGSPARPSTWTTARTGWRSTSARCGRPTAGPAPSCGSTRPLATTFSSVHPVAVDRAASRSWAKDVWVADELSQSLTRITIATSHTHTLDVGDGPTALAALGSSGGWQSGTPVTGQDPP